MNYFNSNDAWCCGLFYGFPKGGTCGLLQRPWYSGMKLCYKLLFIRGHPLLSPKLNWKCFCMFLCKITFILYLVIFFSLSGLGKLELWAKSGPTPVFCQWSFIGTKPHSLAYMLSRAAIMLQWQNWDVAKRAKETIGA